MFTFLLQDIATPLPLPHPLTQHQVQYKEYILLVLECKPEVDNEGMIQGLEYVYLPEHIVHCSLFNDLNFVHVFESVHLLCVTFLHYTHLLRERGEGREEGERRRERGEGREEGREEGEERGEGQGKKNIEKVLYYSPPHATTVVVGVLTSPLMTTHFSKCSFANCTKDFEVSEINCMNKEGRERG